MAVCMQMDKLGRHSVEPLYQTFLKSGGTMSLYKEALIMRGTSKELSYAIGIDEAGRGPIAGPVAVGVVVLKPGFQEKVFAGARDSKRMAMHQRERVYAVMEEERLQGRIDFAVGFSSHSVIDRRGITRAIDVALKAALSRVFKRLDCSPDACVVVLDGSLRAPKVFTKQTTIIGGDDKVLAISLASIAAKVTRDKRMHSYARKYREYGFEQHKGYGTREHYRSIVQNGMCPIHRKTYVKLKGV